MEIYALYKSDKEMVERAERRAELEKKL